MKKVRCFSDIQKIVNMEQLKSTVAERRRLQRIDEVKSIVEKLNRDAK